MDLRPPSNDATLEELREWCRELYEFLQYPAFEVIKFVPRSSAPTGEKGVSYYDSDDDKHKVHNGTAYQDTY